MAALLLSLIEIGIVLVYYGSNHAKLAEQLITLQADRIGSIVREAPDQQAMQAQLAQLAAPTGAVEWSFTVHDRNQDPVFRLPSRSRIPDLKWPSPGMFDWTLSVPFMNGTLISGGRRLPGSDFWVTLSVRGDGLPVFAAVLFREALDHVVLPVMPLTLLLLIVNVQIVRRMLAPLSSAAAQVNALRPARLDSRLHVPDAAHEVHALVVAVNAALDRLQHAMTVLESFTADAAHELRTPLAVLRLRIDSLEPGPLKQRLGEDLTAMTRLVDQLLDLAQADVLDLPPDRAVHLQELARDVVARLQPVAFARGTDLRLIDRGGDSVAGHVEALTRALTNLIDNAIAHSPPGAPVDVIVGPNARLAVRDRGPGIGREMLPLLFKRFSRGPSEGRGGAGLGLAIVHSIVARHGAAIRAGNADGGGAIFTIEWNRPVSTRSRFAETETVPDMFSLDNVATKPEAHTRRAYLSSHDSVGMGHSARPPAADRRPRTSKSSSSVPSALRPGSSNVSH